MDHHSESYELSDPQVRVIRMAVRDLRKNLQALQQKNNSVFAPNPILQGYLAEIDGREGTSTRAAQPGILEILEDPYALQPEMKERQVKPQLSIDDELEARTNGDRAQPAESAAAARS